MAIQTITDENFEEKVMKNAKPFLIRFTAEWCGPCKALAPIVEEISNEMSDVEFGVLDIDSQPNSSYSSRIFSERNTLLFSC